MKKKIHIALSCVLAMVAGVCGMVSCHGGGHEAAGEAGRTLEWRGVMIDVSRHFYPVDVLKRQIDLMGRYGLNMLHLHLTDAAGWRIEIEKYPRLTEVGAWRTAGTWKEWWASRPRPAEGTHGVEWFAPAYSDSTEGFGGYYTAAQLRELVAYAAERGVTIVPEIEFPAHSEEVVAAYPWLGYSHAEMDMSKDSTYMFMSDVLAEVAEIFPGPYIHVGGDESATQTGLQPEAMRRIQAIVEGLGRRMVVWDEGLTDDPADSAQVIMVWRSPETAAEAIRLGHDVVMCPSNWCYLDSYQDSPAEQPEAMGGYRPLSHIYEVPLDSALHADSVSGGRLLGIQACIFTEYVPTPELLEYQLWPRALAIAERGLGRTRPYEDFRIRAEEVADSMRRAGINAFDLKHEYGQRREAQTTVEHKARGAKVTYHSPYNNYYCAGGDSTLTDGVCGTWNNNDHRWQGFIRDLDIVVELAGADAVSTVELSFIQIMGPEIYLPADVTVSLLSDGDVPACDGVAGRILASSTVASPVDMVETPFALHSFTASFGDGLPCRYIHVTAHRGARGGWLFLDEVVVR